MLPILSFSQDKTTKDSLEVVKYFNLIADESNKNAGVLEFKSDTTRLNVEKGIDEKIDGVFRPIADFVGAIIFYPIKAGTVTQTCSFEVSPDDFNSVGDSLMVKFGSYKVNESKTVEDFELISGNGTVRKINGNLY